MRYIDYKKRLFFLFAVVIKKIGLDGFLKILSDLDAMSSSVDMATLESILDIIAEANAKMSECINNGNSSELNLLSTLKFQFADIISSGISSMELIKSEFSTLCISITKLLFYSIDIYFSLLKVDMMASNIVSIGNKEGFIKISCPSNIRATSGIQHDISFVDNYLKILNNKICFNTTISNIINILHNDFRLELTLPKIEVNFPRMRICKIDSLNEMTNLINFNFVESIISTFESNLSLNSNFGLGKTTFRKMNDLLEISSSIFLAFNTNELFEIEIKI